MATRIVEFDRAHCVDAKAHRTQARYQWMLDDPWSFNALWPHTFSALDDDELIAIGGATLLEGASGGWVLFSNKITPARFLVVHRTAVRFLVCFEQINDPIFAHVDPDNPKALRWAALLGLETGRTDVLPNGRRMLRAASHVH